MADKLFLRVKWGTNIFLLTLQRQVVLTDMSKVYFPYLFHNLNET